MSGPQLLFWVFFLAVLGLITYRFWLSNADERWLEGKLLGMPVKTRVGNKEVFYWTLELDNADTVQLENSAMLLRGKTFQEVKSLNSQFGKGVQVRVRVVGRKAEWTYLYPQVLEIQPR